MKRKYGGQPRIAGERSGQRLLTVGAPLRYDGVGNALRNSFRAGCGTVPADMLDLLSKLDRD